MASGLKLVRLEWWWKDTRGVGGVCLCACVCVCACGVEADRPGVARVVSWMSSALLALAEEQSLVLMAGCQCGCGLACGCSFQLQQTWPELTAEAFVHRKWCWAML